MTRARVDVAGRTIGEIDRGLLVLVGVQRGDGEKQARRLAERLLAYRVFPDEDGRMNLDVRAIDGGLLLVPQFTLAADTGRGNRASFTRAADPADGEALFDLLVRNIRTTWSRVATGQFGADMAVTLTNDGPVTFWLEVPPDEAR